MFASIFSNNDIAPGQAVMIIGSQRHPALIGERAVCVRQAVPGDLMPTPEADHSEYWIVKFEQPPMELMAHAAYLLPLRDDIAAQEAQHVRD